MSAKTETCDCEVIHDEIVDFVKSQMLSDNTMNALSVFLKAVADNTRIKILWALDVHEMCVCDMACLLDMTKSAISHQLSALKQANLVKSRREGKVVYYSLADDHVKTIIRQSLSHVTE